MPTPREEMRIVTRRLQPLEMPFVFIGGAVMCLLVDHPDLTEFRPTKDVDVIIEIVTYCELALFEDRLRKAEFRNDTTKGAPICRWIVDGCLVDIMPQDPKPLGMSSRWFPEALQLANNVDLGEGCIVPVVAPPVFLATKLEAFKDRGKGDFYMSHDLEDMITLTDGRANIVDEIARSPQEIRKFVAEGFAVLLKHPDFQDALPGHMPKMAGSEKRLSQVIEKFRAISLLAE
jgi:hypothetical protein